LVDPFQNKPILWHFQNNKVLFLRNGATTFNKMRQMKTTFSRYSA
jgi:hypothetical protein